MVVDIGFPLITIKSSVKNSITNRFDQGNYLLIRYIFLMTLALKEIYVFI